MNLDKRIKSKSDILTCFDTDKLTCCKKAITNHIGKKGYFANEISSFCDINKCKYGTLGTVLGDQQESFYMSETEESFSFFIPECFVKPKEKKYRPYTLEEFQKIFTIGQPIKFRFIGINTEKTLLLIGYEIFYEDNNPETYILIGYETFKLDELLEEYEWQEPGSNVWKPFGVEE